MTEVNFSVGLDPESIQADISINCFLNSFLRESKAVTWQKSSANQEVAIVPLNNGQQLIYIPVSYHSALGIHEYQLPLKLVSQSEKSEEKLLNFNEFLQLIINDVDIVGDLTNEQKSIFIQRVVESRANTQAAIAARDNLQAIYSGELNFAQAEQGLIAGHSVHPAPKSREQFSEEDARLFAPEHQAKFALYWFAVSPSITITDSTGHYGISERIQQLLTADTQLSEAVFGKVPENYLLLPVHPWQAKLLLNTADIQQYQERGLLVNLGAIGENWYPTSSTRSLYSPGLPYMLKFSLSVKLTNSIRNLSLKEVIRGTRLQQVFDTEKLCSFGQQYASFKVMQEPAFIGLINSEGEVIAESLVALRDNLLMHTPQEEAVVLATLTQQHPLAADSLIADRVKTVASHKNISISQAAKYWFNQYCKYVVEPLFALQANYGIVLLAHQQNIVLKMERGEPVGMYYRDCQGTGYTELAYQLFPEQLIDDAQMPENFWNEDKVRRYFPYYLIINSTYNTIAAVSSRCAVSEVDLLHILHGCLKQLQSQGVQDSFCLDFVLQNATLRSKGNFFCYLQNYNENSIPDPAVIYFDLENPIAKIEQLASAKNTSTKKTVSEVM
ncbi:IucA/IucC family protein [Spartinivicinus poritis]|uniref:Uncharacterized protein n=1 Tax=Spartinivicinus poritis TaxID=2994640 RepID=A0ABT5U8X1_9GAMM|nr:IucA/IucC family protein [Spartinivicinus sp. A2-2]MDE1462821.1 hypothetical protein [Spartinivicinus sp. A2-2]